MNTLLKIILVASALSCVSGCGLKGKLKSPAQIEVDQAKKARKEQRELDRDAKRKVSAEEKAAQEQEVKQESQPPEVNPTEPPPSPSADIR